MRKLIFATIICLMAISCGSSKIVMDTSAQGTRKILTTDAYLFENLEIALASSISGKDTVLYVLITSSESAEEGIFELDHELQIRLRDDSRIALKNLYQKEFKKEVKTEFNNAPVYNSFEYYWDPFTDAIFLSPTFATGMMPRSYTRTTTKSYALYPITKKQLNDIISKGVTRLRVETGSEFKEMEYCETVSGILSTLYGYLREEFRNDPKKDRDNY